MLVHDSISSALHELDAMGRGSPGRRRGLSLVELIIVIAIVIALAAIGLPAVQYARECARGIACSNNIRQISLASLLHEDLQRHFPTGGWGFRWHGDPDRGFGIHQPGGWCYQLLPFMDQAPLHKQGSIANGEAKRLQLRDVAETPVPVFICPSRRQATAYPYVGTRGFSNLEWPRVLGKSDYAANLGDVRVARFGPGPVSLEQANVWATRLPAISFTGIVFRRSMIRIADIQDGASHTYLLGEKHLSVGHYRDGRATNDDQGLFMGFDRDTLRCTSVSASSDRTSSSSDDSFGSAHPQTFHMSMCDGSVRAVAYSISPEVHQLAGNRFDGIIVSH